jgi:hypothetical protein
LGHEPSPGDQIETDGYILRIEESDRHRIITLRLIHKKKLEPQDNQEKQSQTLGSGNKRQTMGNGNKSMETSH